MMDDGMVMEWLWNGDEMAVESTSYSNIHSIHSASQYT